MKTYKKLLMKYLLHKRQKRGTEYLKTKDLSLHIQIHHVMFTISIRLANIDWFVWLVGAWRVHLYLRSDTGHVDIDMN